MKTLAAALASLSVLAVPASLQAQPAPASTIAPVIAAPAAADAGRGGEPNVRLTVIEDGGARVEELKVRGETRRIVVQPKLGGRYEIIPADGGRDLATGPTMPRGAVGQRVWRVLQF